MRATLLIVGLAACKADPHEELCANYTKLVVDCRADKSDKDDTVREITKSYCLKGMGGEPDPAFTARDKAVIECTRTATTCDVYRSCEAP